MGAPCPGGGPMRQPEFWGMLGEERDKEFLQGKKSSRSPSHPPENRKPQTTHIHANFPVTSYLLAGSSPADPHFDGDCEPPRHAAAVIGPSSFTGC